jgi:hypothetical protein
MNRLIGKTRRTAYQGGRFPLRQVQLAADPAEGRPGTQERDDPQRLDGFSTRRVDTLARKPAAPNRPLRRPGEAAAIGRSLALTCSRRTADPTDGRTAQAPTGVSR